jgi:pimeloyl-ACP methyl ester carboxylesterase
MNRILRYGLVLVVLAGVCVPNLTGGIFRRTPPSDQQVGQSAAGPAWLSPREAPITPVRTELPLVWVVDGAGGLGGCSHALTAANTLGGNRIEIAPFPWAHRHQKLLLDQIDLPYARQQGARLALAIRERQMREPGRRVVIVAHSAGCAVALAAGETLPPDTIDRMVLLAPSVSTGYDIRPAMRSAREGLDVFCSKKDWVALGFVTRVVGTVDRTWARAAGRHGFDVAMIARQDEGELERLRQHFWTSELAWTGHTGGHHGMHTPAFILTYLYPLFVARESS